MAKAKAQEINFTIHNGHATYDGCLTLTGKTVTNEQLLDPDRDDREFLAEGVAEFYRKHPDTPDNSTFRYNHDKEKAELV